MSLWYFSLQERAEFLLALLAIAEAAELIGNMPHFYARMIGKAFGKYAVDVCHLFAKDRRCDTVILTKSMRALRTVRFGAASFGIGDIEPRRTRAGGCGKHGINAVFIEVIDDFFEPIEMIFALARSRADHENQNPWRCLCRQAS